MTSADPNRFQAPFWSGANIEAYQLEPLRRALGAPRTDLLLADDVGLGKTDYARAFGHACASCNFAVQHYALADYTDYRLNQRVTFSRLRHRSRLKGEMRTRSIFNVSLMLGVGNVGTNSSCNITRPVRSTTVPRSPSSRSSKNGVPRRARTSCFDA